MAGGEGAQGIQGDEGVLKVGFLRKLLCAHTHTLTHIHLLASEFH